MPFFDRLYWNLFTRPKINQSGCKGHWTSYVDRETSLEGSNVIGPRAVILKSQLGKHTYVASGTIALAKVGSFCSVGPQVTIGGLGSHPTHWISTHPCFYSMRGQSGATFAKQNLVDELKNVYIGNDVWIGARAMILDGVTIGDGAIVAAGSVVAKDVEAYSIVGGVPAKLIRYRFSPDLIEYLLEWKWWQLDDEVLKEVAEGFCNTDSWTITDLQRLSATAQGAQERRVQKLA